MTLVSSHDWHDHIDLIEGEPDGTLTTVTDESGVLYEHRAAPNELSQLPDLVTQASVEAKELNALCLLCYASHPIGKYIYENYPIELEDGTTTTFEDWRAEAGRNRVGKSRRRRMHCPRCDFLTDHVAEL